MRVGRLRRARAALGDRRALSGRTRGLPVALVAEAIQRLKQFLGGGSVVERGADVGAAQDPAAVDDEGGRDVDPFIVHHKLL